MAKSGLLVGPGMVVVYCPEAVVSHPVAVVVVDAVAVATGCLAVAMDN